MNTKRDESLEQFYKQTGFDRTDPAIRQTFKYGWIAAINAMINQCEESRDISTIEVIGEELQGDLD